MSEVRQVRPLSVFLLGCVCLVVAVILAYVQVSEPLFWLLYVAGLLAVGIGYVYFAVTLIERDRQVIGWALVWLPALALTVTTSPSIGILPAILAATLEAGVAVGVVMLVIRVARWAQRLS